MSLMLQEIAEQPAALAKTIKEERAKVVALGQTLRRRDIHLIVLVARGSSDNAALFGRYPFGNHHRHSGVALGALGLHALITRN